MFHLGELYRRGHGVPPSASQAETWLRRAAARGHVKALLSLVQLFDSGPEPDANMPQRCCADRPRNWVTVKPNIRLGQYYLDRQGRAFRPHGSCALDIQSGRSGSHRGLRETRGVVPAEGHGLPQDFQAAADWFNRAAVNGDANALYHLGTLQMRGLRSSARS
jgi:hypothetical protein